MHTLDIWTSIILLPGHVFSSSSSRLQVKLMAAWHEGSIACVPPPSLNFRPRRGRLSVMVALQEDDLLQIDLDSTSLYSSRYVFM